MAEALGIASGIAGLLSLTIEVYRISATYVSGVHGATKAIHDLLRELKHLKKVLLELDELATSLNGEDLFGAKPSSLQKVEDAAEYQDTLREMCQKLQERMKGSRLSVKLKSLTWPFTETKTNAIVAVLRRYLAICQAALNIDTFMVGRETLKGVRNIEQQFRNQDDQKILDWLSPSDMSQKQRDIHSRHHKDTGIWLLEEPLFVEWLEKDISPPFLWCPGDPGSGKTVMSSIVVDHIQKELGSEVGLAFVYCDYTDQAKQTASGLVASLAKQLAERGTEQLHQVKSLYEQARNGTERLELRQLTSLLLALCRITPRTFIIIDALDECTVVEERTRFLSVLSSLGEASIKTFVTSRPNLGDINALFRQVPQVKIVATENDIRKYVKDKTEANAAFIRRITPKIKEQIINIIAGRARGMFLMAVLQLERIWRERTATKILRALDSLPSDLTQTYNDTILRIQSQGEPDGPLAMRILQWLSYAKRPLLVDELCHALALEWGDDEELPRDPDRDNVLDPESLIEVCAGLVIIEEESRVIRLVHFTTEEFFRTLGTSLFPDADKQIYRACVTYLGFNAFRQQACAWPSELETRLQDYPFFDYAARHWGFHLPANHDRTSEDMAIGILTDKFALLTMLQTVNPKFDLWRYQSIYQDMTGLHLAAFTGFHTLVPILVKHGIQIDSRDCENMTALSYAAKRGYEEVVHSLLQEGANIETVDDVGRP